jgi:hypothetical protein
LLRLPRPVTPAGSLPPFSVGQHVCPYPPCYRVAFASSRVPYRLHRRPHLRLGDSRGLRLALPQRAHPAYHVSRGSPTSRGRMPLYTGRVDGCVSLPLKLTDLPSLPFWRWGRMVARAPPASRCVTPRLQLPYPYRLFSRRSPHVPLTVLRFTACLIPRRCQRRTHGSGTGGTTPG